MQDCKPASTSLNPGLRLSTSMSPQNDAEASEMRQVPYISVVGSLMYLAVTTRPPISLLIHLSHLSLTLMQTMDAILTIASPLEVMWSRLGLERCLRAQSFNLWSPYPPLKQSTSQQLRQARRSYGCASSWGSWAMMFLNLPCFGWTISPPCRDDMHIWG